MRIINTTPHAVVVRADDGTETTYPSVGLPVRLIWRRRAPRPDEGPVSAILEAPTLRGLPDWQADTYYIVSAMVAQSVRGTRTDLVCPDTDRAIRDEQGRIVAVPGLIKY